tara:strand:- start:292 stop:456 length:165 start_codon:yes stop_codon:yes gene_type:complete
MKRFRVEHNNYEKPDMVITLHNPPYEDKDVISRTKWKLEDCTITDITPQFEGEE